MTAAILRPGYLAVLAAAVATTIAAVLWLTWRMNAPAEQAPLRIPIVLPVVLTSSVQRADGSWVVDTPGGIVGLDEPVYVVRGVAS